MHIGFRHYIKRKKAGNKKKETTAQRDMDRLIYFMTPLTVLIFIPQLLKIWTEKSASGLSLLSWAGMFAGSAFWFVYGIVHKEKPMIVVNIAIGIIQFLIVLGIVLYQ